MRKMDLYLAGCCAATMKAPFPEIMMNTGVDDFFSDLPFSSIFFIRYIFPNIWISKAWCFTLNAS